MTSLIKAYSGIFHEITDLEGKIKGAEEEIIQAEGAGQAELSERVKNLKSKIEEIDECVLKIEAFRQLAEKNLESQNVLTIEAPDNYRVNVNRLRQWAMMIDPASSNDPYAQRVYVVAKCDLFFLEKKKKEFEKKIAELEETVNTDGVQSVQRLERQIAEWKKEYEELAKDYRFYEFAKNVYDRNMMYWYEHTPEAYQNTEEFAQTCSPGAYVVPFSIGDQVPEAVRNHFGKFYDPVGKQILIPVEIPLDREFILTVSCAPTKDKTADKGIRNLILGMIDRSPAGFQKVYVIDGVRFNTDSIQSLKKLENTFALGQIPRNPEQVTMTLEKIVAGFADIDDKLEECDSVKLYNENAKAEQKIPLTTIVLYGWPNAYKGRDRELLQRIMTNYERYGVSIITIAYRKEEDTKKQEDHGLPEYAAHNEIHIRLYPDDTTICFPDGKTRKFTWYVFEEELSDQFAEEVRSHTVESHVIGSEYPKRYDMEIIPPYQRGKKNVVLPYGVDSKDQVQELSFENENFAAYLMGASGSGKSTLLHTLITGIIRNYHPDDVELWLADFKMSEFAQYIDPLPPHVKYILLDESKELVFDLIDRLTDKMMERQRFFMKHRDLKKVENVPSDVYMPVIFVILDEFSIMSQAVAESESYKLKLQNLLAKGRALGIKFIFSSQTFTKGVAGLTQTAKDQIQTRIAMKNSYGEINETLELSSGIRTEQVKSWMETLPPHYTLVKYRDGDHLQVKRLQVMYFKGKGDEALVPQQKMIRSICSRIHPVEETQYDGKSIDTYVDKKPVIVDGNSYQAYQMAKMSKMVGEYRENHQEELSDGDVVLTFGSPRKMANVKFSTVYRESRENLMLLTKPDEQSCAMSVLLSTMKAFAMQGARIQVWAYKKNRLYRSYGDSHLKKYQVAEGMSEICREISRIKEQIKQKQMGNELVILLGMEQICSDFELMDATGWTPGNTVPDMKNLGAVTEEELRDVKEVQDMQAEFVEKYHIDELEDQWIDEGKTMEEIEEEEKKLFDEFLKSMGKTPREHASEQNSDFFAEQDQMQTPDVEEDDSYNASEDFKYIVKQGSRFGYHFMICLNQLVDLKMTGLSLELFRHKLAFQISGDDSINLFASKIASWLPEHICQYSDSLEHYSFRPYIHEGITWDGWEVGADGEASNLIL